MRSLLLAGTAGLFLALGAASAYAVPPNSPYATMVPPGAVDGYQQNGAVYPGYGNDDSDSPGIVEGRAAFVDPDYGYDDPGYVDPGYGYYGHFGGGPRHR
jgi:hypothetical protein